MEAERRNGSRSKLDELFCLGNGLHDDCESVTTESRWFCMLPQIGMHRDCFESCLVVRNRRCSGTVYFLASPGDWLGASGFFGWGATRVGLQQAGHCGFGRESLRDVQPSRGCCRKRRRLEGEAGNDCRVLAVWCRLKINTNSKIPSSSGFGVLCWVVWCGILQRAGDTELRLFRRFRRSQSRCSMQTRGAAGWCCLGGVMEVT